MIQFPATITGSASAFIISDGVDSAQCSFEITQHGSTLFRSDMPPVGECSTRIIELTQQWAAWCRSGLPERNQRETKF